MKSEDQIKEELFVQGLNAFNNQSFYDAHEYWEDLWSDYRLKDAKLIQALIQLSVGYFHITNLNINGARGLLNKCIPKFDLYRPKSRGLDIELIIDSIKKSLKNLDEIDDIDNFNWELVPRLKLNE
tara:strand:+ start:944 stop:1321 length:378 start_codon:yes stop_codon:yes gene_type:complete